MSAAGTSSEEVAPGDCEQEIIGAQWSTEARQACPERGSGDLQPSAEREDLCAHLRRRLPLTHHELRTSEGAAERPRDGEQRQGKGETGRRRHNDEWKRGSEETADYQPFRGGPANRSTSVAEGTEEGTDRRGRQEHARGSGVVLRGQERRGKRESSRPD